MNANLKKSLLIGLLVLMLMQFVHAQDFDEVISNSENWKDVYSTIQYANLKKIGSDFLVSTRHGPLLLNDIGLDKKIRVITSQDMPYVFNYPDMIKDRGFAGVDEKIVKDANLELIEDLNDINNFIIVSDSYGYDAIAVIPYATATDSWVFLANELNTAQIEAILSRRDINKILIYGYVNREIRNALVKYNPETIDTGDRFQDNVEIVKRYLKIKPTKQAVLTNGEFIEKEIMSGVEPILFTGKENVPNQIRDYLKNSEIEIGVLIGNDLVGAATNIKRSAGISVMVKFARGARAQTSGIAAVEGLDLFPLPTPSVMIKLHSVKYNRANSQLEITYKSESNIPVYFKGTITITSNSDRVKVGDLNPIFIAPGDYKTIVYFINLTSLENLEAEVYTLFGEIPSSLDRVLQTKLKVDVIEVIDNCMIDIIEVNYNKQKKAFIIKAKNKGNSDCWADIELIDVIIDNIKRTLGTEGSVKISPGKTKKIIIAEALTEEDLAKNPFVDLVAYFGEREDNLVNVFRGKFELKIESLAIMTYAIIAVVVIIVILIILLIILKRREEDEDDL